MGIFEKDGKLEASYKIEVAVPPRLRALVLSEVAGSTLVTLSNQDEVMAEAILAGQKLLAAILAGPGNIEPINSWSYISLTGGEFKRPGRIRWEEPKGLFQSIVDNAVQVFDPKTVEGVGVELSYASMGIEGLVWKKLEPYLRTRKVWSEEVNRDLLAAIASLFAGNLMLVGYANGIERGEEIRVWYGYRWWLSDDWHSNFYDYKGPRLIDGKCFFDNEKVTKRAANEREEMVNEATLKLGRVTVDSLCEGMAATVKMDFGDMSQAVSDSLRFGASLLTQVFNGKSMADFDSGRCWLSVSPNGTDSWLGINNAMIDAANEFKLLSRKPEGIEKRTASLQLPMVEVALLRWVWEKLDHSGFLKTMGVSREFDLEAILLLGGLFGKRVLLQGRAAGARPGDEIRVKSVRSRDGYSDVANEWRLKNGRLRAK